MHRGGDIFLSDELPAVEIIGNIHQNPKLLGVKDAERTTE